MTETKPYAFPPKDPNAILDYEFDWSNWLGDDTIESFEIETDDSDNSFEVDSATATTTSVFIWVSGGAAGAKTSVTCRITTAGGRTDDRTAKFTIKER